MLSELATLLIGLSAGGLLSVVGLYAGGGGLYAEKYGMLASWKNLKEKYYTQIEIPDTLFFAT